MIARRWMAEFHRSPARARAVADETAMEHGRKTLTALVLVAWFASVVTAAEAADNRSDRAAFRTPASTDIPEVKVAESCEEFVAADYPARCDGPIHWLSQTALRVGGWTAVVDGSRNMIGEYQDLRSSPFWDVDHLGTDGVRSLDGFITGTDNEASRAAWNYAGPDVRADVEYQRFIHNLSPGPLDNFPQLETDPVTPGDYLPVPGDFVAEDLNVGQDYAMRVQQLNARFQGDLTDKIRWRLNVWGMRKAGERQVNSLANCFNHPQIAGDQRQCHLLSRRQQIDWLTMELEPVVEGKWESLTVSYSRPMRSFNQNDQSLMRLHNPLPPIYNREAMPPQLGSEAFPGGAFYPYAVVPENLTQTDKLKLGADLTDGLHWYGMFYHGSTENQHRNFQRDFGGFDLRLTDRTIENLKWTTYGKLNYETNQLPTVLISGEQLTFDRYDETDIECTWSDSRAYGGCGCAPVVVPCVVGEDGVPDFFASDALVPLIDYTRTTLGVNGRWTPFRGDPTWRRGLAVYGRYEHRWLHRENALSNVTLAPGVVADYDQQKTGSDIFHAGVSQRWSRAAETFVRFTTRHDSQPLFGARSSNGTTNSSLPTHTDLVEIGGTWTPTPAFLANLTFGIQNRAQHSSVADFDEDSYPLTVSFWYAPTCALSFSAGYAYFTNWIQQAVTLGDDMVNDAAYAPVTRYWDYGGRSEVWSVGSTYGWTPCVRLRGDVQYVRGRNAIDSTVFDAPHLWPEVAELARDTMDSIRLSAGFDYQLGHGAASYFRYNYVDYNDAVRVSNNGAAHLLLAGLSGRY